jgi:hypothetical protein
MAKTQMTGRQLLAFLSTVKDLDVPVVLPVGKETYADTKGVRTDYLVTKGENGEGKPTSVIVIER